MIVGGTAVDFDATQARGTAFGKTNVVAEHATISGDLRALTVEQFEKAKAAMREIVGTSLPKTSASIVFDEGYPPLAPTDGNRQLFGLFDRASRDLGLGGLEPVDPDRAGAADVSFVAGHVAMIVDAVGLKGRDGHTRQRDGGPDGAVDPDQARGRAAAQVGPAWRRAVGDAKSVPVPVAA